jgi:4-amino-4-deoxy-L-arabinose transferase-like glycosyltransferase
MIRTTGDEKVYIAQAIEMNSLGHWFLQSLNGQPDYYKGPLHYILIQIGLKIFGYSLWSALYMNLLFCIAGAVALAEIVRRTYPDKRHWPFWAGAAFAFNVGVFGHLFASQMEVELAGIFSIALYFLWRGKSRADELIFWALAGLAGWLKSPLHSVLLGCSAIAYWTIRRELFSHLKSPKSLICIFMGILVCILGYTPAYVLDKTNFIQYYIQRENLSKPPNGGPWWQALLPMVSYYLIPWMTLAFLSYSEGIYKFLFKRNFIKVFSQSEKKLFSISLATFSVVGAFFYFHPYRGENYVMPATASIVSIILVLLKGSEGKLLRVRNWILGLTRFPILIIPIILQVISVRFQLPREIWPIWLMPLVWTLSLVGTGLFVWEHFFLKTDGLGVRATLGNVCILANLALFLAIFGEMEVYQLKARIREDRAQGKNYSIRYWNLNRLIWNEWGLMSLAVHEKISPLLTEQDLSEAIQKGDLILARDTDRGKEMEDFAKKNFPNSKFVTFPWNRWKTHASDGAGNSLIGKAWQERDISILWDHALISRFE